MICSNCGMMHTTFQCPYCDNNDGGNIQLQSMNVISNQNSSCCNSGQCSNNNLSNSDDDIVSSIEIDSIPIDSDENYEPKHYIICPNVHCLHKNSRLEVYCTECNTPLPIYDPRLESATMDKRKIQLLDPKAQKKYYQIGITLFIAKILGMEKNVICNNIKQDGSRCQQKLIPLMTDCPQCGRQHGYYNCVSCGRLIPITALSCACGSPSYMADAMKVIDGTAMGKGAEDIIQDLERIFGIPLRKQAYSSYVNHSKIIDGKSLLTNCARQLKTALDLLYNYLRDFTSHSSNYYQNQMMDSYTASYFNNKGVTEIGQIGAPVLSNELQTLLTTQETQLQNDAVLLNNQNETEDNNNSGLWDNTEHNNENDEDDPWNDVSI